VRRQIDTIGLAPAIDREEIAGLEMQYRSSIELAVGHGVGVQVTEAENEPDRGTRLQTAVMPVEDVPLTEPPCPDDFAEDAIRVPFVDALAAFDMKTLGEASDAELPGLLTPLADSYEAWIDAQEHRIDDPAARLDDYGEHAQRHLENARLIAGRIRGGIAALADADVAEAFRFANYTMWQQRVHTIASELRRRDDGLKLHDAVVAADMPKNRSWRPFQLAFVLLNLPALAGPTHPERSGVDGLVDLLFFPTGGGKTEAYLGLTAFAIAIRRLQGCDGRDGVAVLMRYTLRLLTLQQFQRAAALLCACELRRRALYGKGQTAEQRRWGTTPMRIGLWVGQMSTPNRTEDAEAWVKQARQKGGGGRGSSPMQLARCPWCGSELSGGRDIEVDRGRERTLLQCSDTTGQCAFTPRNSPGEGLPVVVVDDEVYRLLPALVIATVDKLARMPWEGRVQALFGQVSRRCERHGYLTPGEEHPGQHPTRGKLPPTVVAACEPLRPPDLIIQDELHLISGPLGSLVGLYETAVDALSTWTVNGAAVRPKVIASTATIRRAGDQVARLFDRKLSVFPPPGLDARDSFFALQRDKPEEQDAKPARRYLGVCAPGRRYKQVLIRVYVAQLRAAWIVLGRQPGEDADAYMTLVGYFNSLRELGGMRRLVEDDVQSRLFRAEGDDRGRLIIEELTSRKSAADIPVPLDQLGVRRLSQDKRKPPTGGGYEAPSIDVLLATNMISVGVDVPRLGAMVVAGQPKSTSEYIQATSRVGRAHPGMVLTVYNWARPRDLSHYETFSHYHRTLYRQVEGRAITSASCARHSCCTLTASARPSSCPR
jgi:helicase-like protein